MSINGIITDALKPIAPTFPDEYSGSAETYIVFNFNDTGALFADNAPVFQRYSVQVHLFCPAQFNSVSMRGNIRQALFAAGLSWADIINAGMEYNVNGVASKQHYVFECEYIEGVD